MHNVCRYGGCRWGSEHARQQGSGGNLSMSTRKRVKCGKRMCEHGVCARVRACVQQHELCKRSPARPVHTKCWSVSLPGVPAVGRCACRVGQAAAGEKPISIPAEAVGRPARPGA